MENKDKMYYLGKTLEIISKIVKIVMIVGIVSIVIAGITIPFIINNTKVNENEITFKYKDNSATLKVEGGTVKAYYDDNKAKTEMTTKEFNKIKEIFEKNSKTKLNVFLTSEFIFAIIYLISMFLVFKNLHTFSKNIKEHKIFEDENVLTLKNMSKYLIFGLVVSLIINIISNQVLKGSFSLGFKLTDIIIIIFVSIVSCIIENGVKTNKKND